MPLFHRAKKRLQKDLLNANFPFDCRITYYDEEDDKETIEMISSIIYVEMNIVPESCKTLKKEYRTKVYFKLSDDHPLFPPEINLEDTFIHPFVDGSGQIRFRYCPIITFPELIFNVYCIILEGLNNEKNESLVNQINGSEPTPESIETISS